MPVSSWPVTQYSGMSAVRDDHGSRVKARVREPMGKPNKARGTPLPRQRLFDKCVSVSCSSHVGVK